MSDEELARRRSEIDAIDEKLLELLAARARLAQEIGHLKGGGQVYRPDREAAILRRVREKAGAPLGADGAARIFTEVISACRGLEAPLAVSFLGPRGTFSEMAVVRHFGSSVQSVPCASIDEVFRKAESAGVQFAVLPVENSTEGAVGRTLDLLLSTPLRICGEVVLRVQQNLMARGASFADAKRVYSHAQSLAQCNQWLAQNLARAERVPVASNAEAARLAAEDPEACAVGPALAADHYGLHLLATSIEDDPNNRTRFLVLGAEDAAATGADRTSLAMSVHNRPGSLHALLSPLAANGVSMSKIESRPARTGQWEYVFFIDLEGHRNDGKVARALDDLKEQAAFLKVLGSYPRAVS